MSKKGGNPENLKAPLSPEEARKFGSMGGKRSVEVRREKKLLSAMYSDMLAKGFNVGGERLSLDQVVASVLERADSSSVSMLKEIREATEGSKTKMVGEDGGPVEISVIKRVIVDKRA